MPEPSPTSKVPIKPKKPASKAPVKSRKPTSPSKHSKSSKSDSTAKKKADASFVMRWHHRAKPPFACLKAGTPVKILDYFPCIDLTIDGDVVQCLNIAKVKIASGKEGYVNGIYIQNPKEWRPVHEGERKLIERNAFPPQLLGGKWFFGCVSALDVAARLCSDPSLPFGSYAVCQPCERLDTYGEDWPSYMLVVKMITGTPEQYLFEWTRDEETNFTFADNYPHRKTLRDPLPGPPIDPTPNVAYITIERTREGLYYVEHTSIGFMNLFDLLDTYKRKPIKLHSKQHIVLGSPALVGPDDSSPPTPLIYPSPICKCNASDVGIESFVRSGPKMISSFQARMGKLIMSGGPGELSVSGELHKGYFRMNGVYTAVSIRRLNVKKFNADAMAVDLTFLEMAQRKKNKLLSDAQRNYVDSRGSEYLLHIFAYNLHGDSFGHWIAYEYGAGFPLDQCLRYRKFEADFCANRPKYEILYQIATGMRFLELNALTHRHLRASNVIVTQELPYLYRVKIVDHMLPYHFQNGTGVQTVDIRDCDWPWWAIESVEEKKFSIRSDAWAFGCVIFEVLTDGLPPYVFEKKKIANAEDLKEFLKSGKKMTVLEPNTKDVETFMHELMFKLFSLEEEKRPTFEDLHSFLFDLLFCSMKDPVETIKKFFQEGHESKRSDVPAEEVKVQLKSSPKK